MSPRFLALLHAEGLAPRRVLDVGSGWGRLALALAPHARHVVGIDRDAGAIDEARRRAAAQGLANAEFHVADAEAVDYAAWMPDLVTAHLCVSDPIVERAARALARGGGLGLVAFHVDQWRETGRVSRFAYDEARMATALRRAGLEPEVLEVEREEQHFRSVEEALAAAVGLEERWRADGRWFRYLAYLEGGGRTLTRSHLLALARKA
ncbi:MAG: class I SAM-dependent methyltransferase [Candidatus Rokubacteria bacterium]|nr:class I SAM-dependent methyltransferase [Candidatus Rokubacteria bacterium]